MKRLELNAPAYSSVQPRATPASSAAPLSAPAEDADDEVEAVGQPGGLDRVGHRRGHDAAHPAALDRQGEAVSVVSLPGVPRVQHVEDGMGLTLTVPLVSLAVQRQEERARAAVVAVLAEVDPLPGAERQAAVGDRGASSDGPSSDALMCAGMSSGPSSVWVQ